MHKTTRLTNEILEQVREAILRVQRNQRHHSSRLLQYRRGGNF